MQDLFVVLIFALAARLTLPTEAYIAAATALLQLLRQLTPDNIVKAGVLLNALKHLVVEIAALAVAIDFLRHGLQGLLR